MPITSTGADYNDLINTPTQYIINKLTVVDGTVINGSSVSTKTASVLIPANTIGVGDVLNFKVRSRKTGIVGTHIIRAYVNTTDAIGGSLVATSATSGTTAVYSQIARTFAVKSATATEGFVASVGVATDDGLTSTAVTNSNINWTVDQYLVIALQNSSPSDSARSSFVFLQINKA